MKEPHCTIKCHKSRSTIKLASTTNDRYSADMFDVVVTNLSNAIIASATYSSSFELIPKPAEIKILCSHYGVPGCLEDLFDATYHDWRFARTSDLAEGGYIPGPQFYACMGTTRGIQLQAWRPACWRLSRKSSKRKRGNGPRWELPAAGAAPTAQPSQSCGTPRPRKLLFAPPAPQAGEWKPAAGHGANRPRYAPGLQRDKRRPHTGQAGPEAAEASGTQRPTLRRGGTGGRHCASGEGGRLPARNAAKGALRPLAPGNGTAMHNGRALQLERTVPASNHR